MTEVEEELLFSVNELARTLGMTPRAIRFYETKGLISPRRVGATRVFTTRDRARLTLILRGKRLGFSLQDIADYFSLYADRGDQTEQIRLLLARAEARRAELEQQRRDLEATLRELNDIIGQASARLAATLQGSMSQ